MRGETVQTEQPVASADISMNAPTHVNDAPLYTDTYSVPADSEPVAHDVLPEQGVSVEEAKPEPEDEVAQEEPMSAKDAILKMISELKKSALESGLYTNGAGMTVPTNREDYAQVLSTPGHIAGITDKSPGTTKNRALEILDYADLTADTDSFGPQF